MKYPLKIFYVLIAFTVCLTTGFISTIEAENTSDQPNIVSGDSKPCLYGLNFAPYEADQDPNMGTVVSAEQIERRMKIVAPCTEWIRTFGCTKGMEHAGRIAKGLGLKTAIGAWISSDRSANGAELRRLIQEAGKGNVDIAIIGSEVLLRGDLTLDDLIAYMRQFRSEVPNVPMTSADVYFNLLGNPRLMAECDVILVNYYPYWEGVPVKNVARWLHVRHQRLVTLSGGKEVIISETGWPSAGDIIAEAVPTPENAAFFFMNFISWARAENIRYFYFEAFDEPWKAVYEGPQGAHWGVWDKNGKLKPGMQAVLDGETMDNNWTCKHIPGGMGRESIEISRSPFAVSLGTLYGQVWHAAPDKHLVAVYIKVDNGWWTKPYFNNPVSAINCDGSWTCDINTGGMDQMTTEIAAFLIPLTYSPPIANGLVFLPDELYTKSPAYVVVTRD
ncbi:MAG: glycosyl hydrolase family 17 protein [Bacteroidales bacterium]